MKPDEPPCSVKPTLCERGPSRPQVQLDRLRVVLFTPCSRKRKSWFEDSSPVFCSSTWTFGLVVLSVLQIDQPEETPEWS